MSRKNFKVETTEKGQTTKSDNKHSFVYKDLNVVEKTKVPTGKVTTLEDKKKRREAREKQYREFRIAALKHRAKRMGIPDEKIQELVEKLCEQLDTPKKYMILALFKKDNKKMIMEILKNNNIEVLMSSDSHLYVKGDQELLKKIRELMPEGTKIHPYATKESPILPIEQPPKEKKRSMSKKDKKIAAHKAKIKRKTANKLAMKHKKEQKEARKQSLAAKKKAKAIELKAKAKTLKKAA